jgi:hypothetical protein
MKVAIVGNCQARPLGRYLSLLKPEIEIVATPIVHLLKEHERDDCLRSLEQADFIISQNIADSYPCSFIRTSLLKQQFGDKVNTILNLYFSGYTPDLLYIRHPTVGTLRGPLGEYHSKTILDGWLLGIDPKQVVNWLSDPFYNQQEYAEQQSISLAELKDRELSVDIKITDFIQHNLLKQRLFFTFNHPCALVLTEYAQRILEYKIGERGDLTKCLKLPEQLDQIIPKLAMPVAELNGNSDKHKGQAVTNVVGPDVSISEAKYYTDIELVECFYHIYAKNDQFIREKYDT